MENGIPVTESTGGSSTVTHKSEENKKNYINGIYSAAFGGCNVSNDGSAYSMIAGYENKIDGAGKNALFGLRNLSTTDTAFAANRYNVVNALASFAFGERNQVSAQNAGALGNRLVATNKSQVSVGRLNARAEDALFVVGNGKSNRQNAMTVLEDGTVTIGGHFENILLDAPVINAHDDFNNYMNDYNIGAPSVMNGDIIETRYDVPISADWSVQSNNTALFMTHNTNKTPTSDEYANAVQANITGLKVTAGCTYTLTMSAIAASSDYSTLSYWLAVLPEEEKDACFSTGTTTGKQFYSKYNVCLCENVPVAASFGDISVTFNAPISGIVRIGVCGSQYMAAYFIGNFRLENKSKYNYVANNGITTELYRIADIPCDTDYINDWLIGRTITTSEYGEVQITSNMISTDSDLKDNRKNCVVVHEASSTILMCIVDSIAPTNMSVNSLGIYVAPTVTGISYEKWIDDPLSNTSGTTVELDTTLTQPDMAADAKAVGDAINTVEEALTAAGQVLATKIGTETGWGTKQLQSISNMEDDTLVHGVYYVNGANDSELGVVNGILIHVPDSHGAALGKQILITNNATTTSSRSSFYVRSWIMGSPTQFKWEQIGGNDDSGVDITQFGWGTNDVKTIADLDDYTNILNGVYWFDGTNESLANAIGSNPYGIFVQMYNSNISYGAQMFFHMALKDGVYTADVYTRQIMWNGVHDWHEIGGGSDVSIDATLTQEGQAADAKAVGDWMNNVILSENNYGTSLPETGEDGLVYFVEENHTYEDFGLGVTSNVVELSEFSAINNLRVTGWYSIVLTSGFHYINDLGFEKFLLRVESMSDALCKQTFVATGEYMGSGQTRLITMERHFYNSQWYDWTTVGNLYPVGAIYMSVSSKSPAFLFGGTWERIKDKFLLAAGDTYSAGATGGEAAVTLTTAQMPKHRHTSNTNLVNAAGAGTSASAASGTSCGFAYGTGYYGSYSGSGESHNNMPPYLVVYIWKRVS